MGVHRAEISNIENMVGALPKIALVEAPLHGLDVVRPHHLESGGLKAEAGKPDPSEELECRWLLGRGTFDHAISVGAASDKYAEASTRVNPRSASSPRCLIEE